MKINYVNKNLLYSLLLQKNEIPLRAKVKTFVRKGIKYHSTAQTPNLYKYSYARCVALRCVALRCVALRCVALRCVSKIRNFIEFCKFFIINLHKICLSRFV